MTFDNFVKKYLGKATDIDGVSGVQCVDLAKMYIKYVIGATPQSIGNAHAYYDYFEQSYLKNYFVKIPYKAGLKAQKGDIVVWKIGYNGRSKYGHIAIATGEATDTTITTYDQNWSGKSMKKVAHSYTGIAGYLRPKDQSNIITTPIYKIGKTVTLLTNLKVRKGAGINYAQKKRSELTANGQKNALNGTYAVLKKGTRVTVLKKAIVNNDIWVRIPSGWIAVYYNGNTYAK